MPIDQVLKLVGGLELDSQSINTWKMGVERALKKYLPNGTKAAGQTCPNCGHETLIYQGRLPYLHFVRSLKMRLIPSLNSHFLPDESNIPH